MELYRSPHEKRPSKNGGGSEDRRELQDSPEQKEQVFVIDSIEFRRGKGGFFWADAVVDGEKMSFFSQGWWHPGSHFALEYKRSEDPTQKEYELSMLIQNHFDDYAKQQKSATEEGFGMSLYNDPANRSDFDDREEDYRSLP